jgi:hypothetical protein
MISHYNMKNNRINSISLDSLFLENNKMIPKHDIIRIYMYINCMFTNIKNTSAKNSIKLILRELNSSFYSKKKVCIIGIQDHCSLVLNVQDMITVLNNA